MGKYRLYNLLLFTCIVLFLSSCIDKRYDMDNISNDMHLFENGISIPLLRTGDLRFEKLISSQNDIRLNEEGVYEFYSEEKNFHTHIDKIPKISVSAQQPNFGTIKSHTVTINGFSTETIPLDKDITSYETILNIETEKLDDRLIEVYSVSTHSNWVSKITLSVVDENERPLSGDLKVKGMVFDNYKLIFPKKLIIDNIVYVTEGINCIINSNNEITLNGSVDGDVLELVVKINGVDGGDENLINTFGEIVLSEKIEIGGNISLDVMNSGNSIVQTFKVKPTLFIPGVKMDEGKGGIKVDVEIMEDEVKIGSLPSFITSEGTSLKLTNPYMPLYVTSTAPMRVKSNIKMYPKDADGNYIYDNGEKVEVLINDLSIPGDNHGDALASNFYEYVACEKIGYYDNNGFKYVECMNLDKICAKIPTSIEIIAEGESDASDIQDFYFDEEFNIDINYRVHVPFSLNSGSKIQYNDSTLDLNADIFDVISAKSIFANAIIKNGFPVEMDIFAELCDVNGEKLDGIEVVIPQKIKASESVGITDDVVPEQTYMRIEFRETKDGQMKLIDRINWRVNAYFPDQGVISKYQKLNMKINLELPDGISIDLDNL